MTNNKDELLPCPFCGHDAPLLVKHSSDAGNEYSVLCYQGCCEIGDEYEAEAIAAWNTRRAALTSEQEATAPDSALVEKLAHLDDPRACIGKTQYIPIHRTTLRDVLAALRQQEDNNGR